MGLTTLLAFSSAAASGAVGVVDAGEPPVEALVDGDRRAVRRPAGPAAAGPVPGSSVTSTMLPGSRVERRRECGGEVPAGVAEAVLHLHAQPDRAVLADHRRARPPAAACRACTSRSLVPELAPVRCRRARTHAAPPGRTRRPGRRRDARRTPTARRRRCRGRPCSAGPTPQGQGWRGPTSRCGGARVCAARSCDACPCAERYAASSGTIMRRGRARWSANGRSRATSGCSAAPRSSVRGPRGRTPMRRRRAARCGPRRR